MYFWLLLVFVAFGGGSLVMASEALLFVVHGLLTAVASLL